MRTAFISLVTGTLFGAGLALGGMTDPARVRGFPATRSFGRLEFR